MRLEGQQGNDRTQAKQISSDGDKTRLGEYLLRQVMGVPYYTIISRQHLDAYGRTDISFTKLGTDMTTGEAVVQADFLPLQ